MDDKTMLAALDITLDQLTRRKASQEEVRQAVRNLLKDWTPDDALRQHSADQSRATHLGFRRRFLDFHGWFRSVRAH
jgi:hypothetical protein